jgi:hypothetical protein
MKEESVTLNGQTSGIVCPEWAEREELLTAWAEQLRGQARRESEGIEELTPQMLRVYAAAIGLGVPRIARQAEAADARSNYVGTGCNVLIYGGRIYGFLRGVGCSPAQVAEAGLAVLDLVAEKIAPRRTEVEKTASFFAANEGPQAG